jgi:hypothetical protein
MGAAVRIGALIQMAASGAAVGMQWQPQESSGMPGEGLWTSCVVAGGGQPSLLAKLLASVLAVLAQPVTLAGAEPSGVAAVTGAGGTIAVNAGTGPATATVGGLTVPLGPGQVSVILG